MRKSERRGPSVRVHPLDGVQGKIERGWEHQRKLRTEIKAFEASKPYSVGVTFDPESGWHVARLHVASEPSVRLSIIAGEMAYEYISALNHVAWELAARKLGRKRAWACRMSVQFPVTVAPEQFEKQVLAKEGLVSKQALDVLRQLQPYAGRDGQKGARRHSLWLLKELADSDKHRVLAPRVSSLVLRELEYDWDTPKAGEDFKIQGLLRPGQRLYDGKALGRIRFATRNAARNVTAQHGDIPIDVLFETGDWMLTTTDFGTAHAFMTRALKALAPLFPPRADA
jgi:hypothetical protein